jgi:hypothetical protein
MVHTPKGYSLHSVYRKWAQETKENCKKIHEMKVQGRIATPCDNVLHKKKTCSNFAAGSHV